MLIGDKVAAVLEFFTPTDAEPSSATIQTLLVIGTQLGRVFERAKAEQELQEQRNILQHAIADMSEGFALYDADEKLVLWNDGIIEMWPSLEAVIRNGMTFTELLDYQLAQGNHPPDFDVAAARAKQLSLFKDADGTRGLRRTEDGRWIQSRMRRTVDGFTVITRTDVTDMKTAETELKKNRAELRQRLLELQDREQELSKQTRELRVLTQDLSNARDALEVQNTQKDKFFSIIAHDLKSPFTTLVGMTDVLANHSTLLDAKETKAYAAAVNVSATRMFELLENLLEWARSQMDRVQFDPETLDLESVVSQSFNALSDNAEAKGINFRTLTTAHRVSADRPMLDTVLRNLIGNAIKFTPQGGTVSITAAQEGTMTTVCVSDTGTGMPPQVADSLFRLGKNTSTRGTAGESGTGLGLLICKEFIEKHGGEIAVESTLGQGTTFRFTLPSA